MFLAGDLKSDSSFFGIDDPNYFFSQDEQHEQLSFTIKWGCQWLGEWRVH